jgi:PAS domain S-box-containing protein
LSEIYLPESAIIVSKTDLKGHITYGNDIFISMSGYTEAELIGTNHNILRHPDMPKCVFKLIWDTIEDGNEIFGYVKNLTKDGNSYWVKAHVTPSKDSDGRIKGYHSKRTAPKKQAIDIIAPLYEKLSNIERSTGVDGSTKALNEILKNAGRSYDEFILSI